MDTAQFLARVVAPGNYTAIGFNRGTGTPINGVRMFPQTDIASAANYALWAANEKWDVYHAQGSYNVAELIPENPQFPTKSKKPRYKGDRGAGNVQRLKSFYIDFDVKRDGDKKNAANSYTNQLEALQFLIAFRAALNLPRPSVVVNSGYGLHVYWVLEDALSLPDWQPHADALKAALIQHKFRGDPGISADGARYLRPPGTVNTKSGVPVPVTAIDRLSGPDVPNSIMLACLQPFLGMITRANQAQAQQAVGTASALAGGGSNVTSIFTAAGVSANMSAAAATNLPPRADRLFSRMAQQNGCNQVITSLANHGAGDQYPLWYLGFLSAAHYCADGGQFVHPISDGDPRYSIAGTNAAVARVSAEHARKGHGWPSCAHFERARPSVCQACPHHGRLSSPLDLATDDGDLPMHYRRARGGIEVRQETREGQYFWVAIIKGDVYAPVLDEQTGFGYALSFKHDFSGKTFDIHATGADLSTDAGAIYKLFQSQKLMLAPGKELHVRGFILAWIDLLREKGAERAEKLPPFGWAQEGAKHLGFAYAGTLYRVDGSQESTPMGDRHILSMHQPQGDLAEWQVAANFVTKGRVDLQTIVASAFAAPLVRLTGHKGLLFSAWGTGSGRGKSSAIAVGQAVWAAPGAGMSLDDTHNSVRRKIAETRNLPAFWDEMQVGSADDSLKFVQFVFALTQGKERARLDRDSTLKAIGEWETMLTACANKPLMDAVTHHTQGTEAGALRVFEFRITHPPQPLSPVAQAIVAKTGSHYGRAGEVYAKWLATNRPRAAAIIEQITAILTKRVAADQTERLHIATMATVLAGASIARSLGILAFDIPQIETLLVKTFVELRAERRKTMLVGPSGYDLEELLAGFWEGASRYRLVVDRFPKGNARPEIILPPLQATGVEVQVSQFERLMRISRNKLAEYLRRKNLPVMDVIRAMEEAWGAVQGRRVFGAGTVYGGGGNIWCLEIPLTRPELEGYLQCVTQPQAAAPGLAATLQAPTPAIAAMAAQSAQAGQGATP